MSSAATSARHASPIESSSPTSRCVKAPGRTTSRITCRRPAPRVLVEAMSTLGMLWMPASMLNRTMKNTAFATTKITGPDPSPNQTMASGIHAMPAIA